MGGWRNSSELLKEVLAVMQSVTNGVLVSTTTHRDLDTQNLGHYRTLSKY
jgi:hypothetical protein